MTTSVWKPWVLKTITQYRDECAWSDRDITFFHGKLTTLTDCLDKQNFSSMYVYDLDKSEPLLAVTKAAHALALYDSATSADVMGLLSMLSYTHDDGGKFAHLPPSIKKRIIHHPGWNDVTLDQMVTLQKKYGMAWVNVAHASVLQKCLRAEEIRSLWPNNAVFLLKNKGVSFDGLTKKEVTALVKNNQSWAMVLYERYPKCQNDKCFIPHLASLFLHFLKEDSSQVVSLWETLVNQGSIKMRRQPNGNVHIFVHNGHHYPIHDALFKSELLKNHPLIQYWKSADFALVSELIFHEQDWFVVTPSMIPKPSIIEESTLHL